MLSGEEWGWHLETHKVILGSVTLHGYADGPDPWSGLLVSAINGWRGLPGSRGSSDSIPGSHGSYSATSILREERSIEVVGAAVAESEAAANAMLRSLEAEVADRPVIMRVVDTEGMWERLVEVEDLAINGRWNVDRIRFTIDAIAADPIRYRPVDIAGPIGIPVREGGLVLPDAFPWSFGEEVRSVATVDNTGDVPLYPTVILRGSANSVSVRGGNSRIDIPAFSGELILDHERRRALLNGVDVTRALTLRQWGFIPAGGRADFEFIPVNPASDLLMMIEFKIGAW